ncbi:MAG: hypothetical protein K2W96_14650, partial [Gemmataceae bacterium]|nr:hypothetical protein [Gemmataceae bacterium]
GLDELAITGSSPGFDWAAFAACDGAAGLRSLLVPRAVLADAHAEALASAPHLRGLRRVHADGRALTARGLAALARLPLRRLDLYPAAFALDALERLADGPCRDTLEELRIGRFPAEDAFPAMLDLPRLRRLEMALGPSEAQGLARSGLMGRLDLLDTMANAPLPRLEEVLGTGPGPRSLSLRWRALRDTGAAALAGWPGLARVRCLDLSYNGIGRAGIVALAESPHATALEALSLSGNSQEATPALIRSPVGQRLAWLDVSDVPGQREIAQALLDAPPPRLRELRLDYRAAREIGPRGMAALRAALPDCAIGQPSWRVEE